MKGKKIYTLLFLVLLYPVLTQAQTSSIIGIVTDETGKKIPDARVTLDGGSFSDLTDSTGSFKLTEIPFGNYTLSIRTSGYADLELKLGVTSIEMDLGQILINFDNAISTGDNLPMTSLMDSELKESNLSGNVSGVLGASRDPFISATTFSFSIARFRIRGYENGYTPTLMNGANMTDLTTGRDMFYTWSGLNDVVRARENSHGLESGYNSYGSLAGSLSIDSRAARQRKQLQASFAVSNRTYDNRLMVTYGTGVLKGGWSFAGSFSRRWAQEGYVKGTFYDSWAYFGSAEKDLGSDHSLCLTFFGNALRNGRQSPATQEMYDIAGSNYYNPNWGYQNGKVRNASVGRSHTPVIILTHDWKIDNSSSLETSVSRIAGKNKISGLDWFNATDPRPDFYRRMPSYIRQDDPEQAAIITALLSNSEEERQIKWDRLYETNYHSDSILYNANGISGLTVTGKWANYLVMDRVTAMQKTGFNSVYNKTVSDNTNFTAGFSYQKQVTEYYKEVNDLLGADFYVDLNQYAEQSNIDSVPAVQNDVNNPNRVLYEGDRYGYNYIADITKTTAWAQGVFKYKYFEYFFAVELSAMNYFRDGKYRNGVFINNSFGKSDHQKFVNYSAKAGITYKYNGRNYFFVNASYLNQAPEFEDSYISPKTRNTIVDGITSESASSIEGGYLLKAPSVKARAVFYATEFKDEIRTNSFYHEDYRTFVNYTLSNIDRHHTGAELAIEANLGMGFSVTGVAALGRYIITSNPNATISQDNKDTLLAVNEIAYLRNFHVESTPEKAFTFGVNYRAKKFWFVYLNFNLFDDIYIAANPARRTSGAIDLVDPDSELYDKIVTQEKVDRQFTMDISGGKSWRLNNTFKLLKKQTFVLLNAGFTNILNNRKFINGGFEQLRFDYFDKNPDKFANKYFYSYGTTFFISITLRFN